MTAIQAYQILYIFMVIFFVWIASVGIRGIGGVLRDIRTARTARTWPTTEGIVTTSGVTEDTEHGDATMYTPDVRFRYTVGGTEYTGTQFRLDPWTTSSKKGATKEAAKYPLQAPVTVRYDPASPANSLIETNTGSATAVTLTFGFGLVVMALILGPLAAWSFLLPR